MSTGRAIAKPATVLVTSRSFGTRSVAAIELLRRRDLEVVRASPAHEPGQLREILESAVGWIAGTGPIGPALLDAAVGLRVIARYGVGVDAVDLEAAAARGIVVTNTPGANTEAVADHAVALLLAAVRQVVAGDRASRAGDWSPRVGREIAGMTVGIVGFGRVGRAVAVRLSRGFGARVVVHDPFVGDAEIHAAGHEPVSLHALAQTADALSLHLPAGDAPLVDAPFLRRLRPGSILVNTARGELIDEKAAAIALATGRLGALATDVLAVEHGRDSPLLAAPNVTITPHVAAQTAEAIERMGMMAAEEVVRVLDGQAPLHPVTAAITAAPR